MIELNSIIKKKNSYYMITNATPYDGYVRVQKCSKKGKLYKYTNGFHISVLQGLFNGLPYPDFELIRRGGETPVNANIEDGIESGKRKRRIQFLQNRIKTDTDELLKLQRIELFSKT
jgi:hypothetical protein